MRYVVKQDKRFDFRQCTGCGEIKDHVSYSPTYRLCRKCADYYDKREQEIIRELQIKNGILIPVEEKDV